MTGTAFDDRIAGDVESSADFDEPRPVRLPESSLRGRRGGRGGGRRGKSRPHRLRRKVLTVVGFVVIIPTCFVAWSVIGAATTPGNYSFKAKWADWLRSHNVGFVVTRLENSYFRSHQPHKGGTITKLHSLPGVERHAATTATAERSKSAPTTTLPPHLPAPKPVPLVVQPAAPGEGQWKPAGPLIHGLPGMYVAQFRADDVYTSQITSAVWIDPKLLRVRFHPGTQEPPGNPPGSTSIEGAARNSIVAAFNGGFRFKDARGGAYVGGRMAVPLVNGAASIVIHTDGRIEIGAWNRDVGMSSDVESVLQNLTLMVDNGQLDPAISHNDTSAWGYTLDGVIATARSGIGITANGALVYVAGPALTAKSLAESLMRAGAVRAMTLDLNPEWVTFLFYSHPNPNDPATVVGTKLYPGIQRTSDRYLTPDARDFFTVSTG